MCYSAQLSISALVLFEPATVVGKFPQLCRETLFLLLLSVSVLR